MTCSNYTLRFERQQSRMMRETPWSYRIKTLRPIWHEALAITIVLAVFGFLFLVVMG